jgi:hypothetical protein
MSKLNLDVIFLIIKNLSDDTKSLLSCLLVNRIWCEVTVPFLWKSPFYNMATNKLIAKSWCGTPRNNNYIANLYAKKKLLNVILLHLSEESREHLKNQKVNFFVKTHQQPLFDYISFWKRLNLSHFENMIVENIRVQSIYCKKRNN